MKSKYLVVFVFMLLISTFFTNAMGNFVENDKTNNLLIKNNIKKDINYSKKINCVSFDDIIYDISFNQIDWYFDGELHTIFSSWGRMDFTAIPGFTDIHYMNVVAIATYEPTWIIQNYPVLPQEFGVPNNQAVNFNIEDFGIPQGYQLPWMQVLITFDTYPYQEPPYGDFYDVPVYTLIRDAWGHGDEPPADVGAPIGHRARNIVENIAQHENVPSVQEDSRNCIAGSYSRSIKWLDNEYDLENLDEDTTAQDVYDNLTALGVGHGTGMGKTEEEMLTLKSDYLEGLDNRSVTKFVDFGYLGNVDNATEETTDNLSSWLSSELETEDIEMCYDSHCVTITGMYKQGNQTYLRYRDDERQGNDSVGDNRTKSGLLENDSGTWKFKGFKIDYVVSESINNPPENLEINGENEGQAGEAYEYTFRSTDQNDDDLFYYIDWDDENIEEWIGPFSSGEEIVIDHIWDEEGTYMIRAKAKDIYGDESNWEFLEVTMPLSFKTINPRLQNSFNKFPNFSFLIGNQLKFLK